MEKKILSYFIALLVIQFSCNSPTNLKKYGVITSEIGYNASIDTITHPNHPVPITLTVKLFELKNQSDNQKIVFVCKCTGVNGDGSVLEITEKYAVGPQETVKLNYDSIFYRRIVKYEIVDAYLANDKK